MNLEMNQTLLTVFVAVTAIAVVLQMAILFALYLTTRKTAENMQALAKRVEGEALPTLQAARVLLVDNRPRIDEIITNFQQTSVTVRTQAERISTTMDDVVDRTRLQIIRADEMVTRTFDRVEETADTMQHSVLSPLRKLSGVMTGIIAGFGEFIGGRQVRRAQKAVPRDEMFI